jgi:hypothetical protein
MKRLFFLTAILAVLGLSSCEKEPSQKILGTWDAVSIEVNTAGVNMTIDMSEMNYKVQFTFKADGTGTIYVDSQGENGTENFVYEISGDNLIMTKDGETITVPFRLKAERLTLEFSEGINAKGWTQAKIHFQKK